MAAKPGAAADGELGRPRRRDFAAGVVAPALVAQVAAAAWLQSPAVAEDSMSIIISESRRKAKEDAKKPSIFNPNSYKTPTGNYDATNLQSFLPTVYLSKRQFEQILMELGNPKVNATDFQTYDQLRELNRLEPTKLLRKDAFRTKLWLQEKTGKYDVASSQYERMKRALDEEDTQCLLLSRTEGLVDVAAIRTTKRNVEAVIDAIDQLLELVPLDDQVAAKAVADTKGVPAVRLIRAASTEKPAAEKPAAAASETSDA